MPAYVQQQYVINKSPGKTFYGRSFVYLGNRPNIVDGLGSYIDHPKSSYFYDTRGKTLKADNQAQFSRLKNRYSLETRIAERETDYRVLRLLNRVVDILRLSNDIRNRAAYFYKKVVSLKKKEAFTNHVLLVAVCLLNAIREYGVRAPKTIGEVASCFYELGHRVSTRHLVREMLKLKVALGIRFPQRKSSDYLGRIISQILESKDVLLRLKISGWKNDEYHHQLMKSSHNILHSTPPENIGGRNPYIFATSTIYAADKLLAKKFGKKNILTQKILSQITGVAQYSIRDHYCKVLKEAVLRQNKSPQEQEIAPIEYTV
jgi:transcription initiation factor TFIIIB Brf1 subunit/transcription initiation factor TFIIB